MTDTPTVTFRIDDLEISISRLPSVRAPHGGSLRSIWPAELVERVEVDLLREDEPWERTTRWR